MKSDLQTYSTSCKRLPQSIRGKFYNTSQPILQINVITTERGLDNEVSTETELVAPFSLPERQCSRAFFFFFI